MPTVGKKKFKYSAKGKAEAKTYAKKKGLPVYKAAMGRAQFATTTSKPSMFVQKLQPSKAVLGLYAMNKMSDKKKDKVKSHFKKRASLLSPVASQFFNKGGPIKAKHGKYIPIPTPHADIAKYVTKKGVVEGPEGEDTYWRRKDSTMKFKKPRRSSGRPQAPKAGTLRPKGGWTA